MGTQNIIDTHDQKLQATFALSIAEIAVEEIKSDAEGYLLAKEAFQLCWEWVIGRNIPGNVLAEYVDSPTKKDLGMREEYYGDNQNMISALVAITLAIGLVSRFAYNSQGVENMPTPIWEIDEKSLHDIVNFASNTKHFNVEKISEIYKILEENFNHEDLKVEVIRQSIQKL